VHNHGVSNWRSPPPFLHLRYTPRGPAGRYAAARLLLPACAPCPCPRPPLHPHPRQPVFASRPPRRPCPLSSAHPYPRRRLPYPVCDHYPPPPPCPWWRRPVSRPAPAQRNALRRQAAAGRPSGCSPEITATRNPAGVRAAMMTTALRPHPPRLHRLVACAAPVPFRRLASCRLSSVATQASARCRCLGGGSVPVRLR